MILRKVKGMESMKTKGFLGKKTTKENVILLGIIAVLSVLYLSLCFNYNLAVDEAYSVRTFHKDWPELIERTAGDTHPPLYYFMARIALLAFGEVIPRFKMVPAAFGILSLLLAVVYIRPRFGFRTAVGYTLFFFGIPYTTEYVIQIRMYSPLLFFVTWTALAAIEVYYRTDKKHWFILFVAALCACYTHNYGLLAAFVIYVELGIFLMIRKAAICRKANQSGSDGKVRLSSEQKRSVICNREMGSWLLSGIALVICFFPWMLVLLHQMEHMPEHFMAQPVTGGLILEILTELFASDAKYTTYMFWFLFVLALLCCKWKLVGKIGKRKLQPERDAESEQDREELEKDTAALCMFGVFFFTLLLGILLSLIITPLLMTRYMVSCLGVFSVFMAYGLQKLPMVSVELTKKLHIHADPFLLIGIFVFAVGIQSYATNYRVQYLQYKTNDTVAFFQDNLSAEDVVIYNEPNTRWVYECYFEEDQLVFLSDMDFSRECGTIWFMDSCCEPWLSDEVLTQNGLNKTYMGAYGIQYNDFSLYKISRQ